MTIQQIFDLGIKMGMEADPRGAAAVKKILEKRKKEYEEMSEKKKKYFDKDSLTNPYLDSGILYGAPEKKIKKILAGIDTDAAELLLVDRLNQKGMGVDLVIGHHPIGKTLATLHAVMDLQTDSYAEVGVPVNLMDALMRDRMETVKRRIHPSNFYQVVDTARMLDIPLLNMHTIWDNMGDKFMKEYLAKKTYDTVGEIVDYIMEIPEYQEAMKVKNGPEIVSGSPTSRAGKVAIFFTGGTNPSKEAYIELAKAGVGTLVDMHITEDALPELKKLHVNVINAGHMASDSIGANLFFDKLEKEGIEVVGMSGLIRIKRLKS
jgi:putative NIF3 family GTP cyclohydrolase 1 type 2